MRERCRFALGLILSQFIVALSWPLFVPAVCFPLDPQPDIYRNVFSRYKELVLDGYLWTCMLESISLLVCFCAFCVCEWSFVYTVCMYIYVCFFYVCVCVRLFVCISVRTSLYVCLYVCTYIMHICLHIKFSYTCTARVANSFTTATHICYEYTVSESDNITSRCSLRREI